MSKMLDGMEWMGDTRQACSSHNSTWLWDECGDPLRAAAGKVTASKYIFEVTNFLENSCQPSCICVNQSVIFVFTQTSLKPPQKHWWSSQTISDCSFRWNWKYFLRIWWSDLSFSQFCIYFPGDFIRFAGRELLVSEMIFLMFFPPSSCSKTNRNFNRHLFLLKNWNNHAPPSLVPQPTCYWNSFFVNMHQWYPLIWRQLNNETHAQMFDDSAISPDVFEDYWQEQPYLITVSTKQIFCCINVFTDINVLTDDITTKKLLLR